MNIKTKYQTEKVIEKTSVQKVCQEQWVLTITADTEELLKLSDKLEPSAMKPKGIFLKVTDKNHQALHEDQFHNFY